MRDFNVRRLGCDDVTVLQAVNRLFAEVFDDPGSYAAAPPEEAYLWRLLGSETFVALVAEAQGEVIGALIAYELDKFEQARREFYLYDLGVAEAFRRQGIASRLIALLSEIAVERGGDTVFVQADLDDVAASALYARFGEGRPVLHFDIERPPPSSA